MTKWQISIADLNRWVVEYSGEKFHALLRDPPYNLESITKRYGKQGSAPAKHGKDGAFSRVSAGFMGKEWDSDVAFNSELWEALGNHLHPGAFGLAFSSTRTYHRLATAIEDAGYIIHPMFGWIQSQGFPKATKIDNQIDRMAGEEHEVDLAKAWKGHRYGLQAIAPTMEPICLFQKPYEDKPLESIVDTGAGALNIEGTRYGEHKVTINRFDSGMKPFGDAEGEAYKSVQSEGYWPKNIITEDGLHGEDEKKSKFFLQLKNYKYHKKAMRKEKELGIDGKNPHPTVKPVGLIEYLAKLLLPPDIYSPRRILVPFSGVASEIIGCGLAGWEFIHGVEMSNEYALLGAQRLRHWLD